MTEDAALPRETGAEKAPTVCPNCGREVPALESPYGGISGAACPDCYPASDPSQPVEADRQQASENDLPREQGTVTSMPQES